MAGSRDWLRGGAGGNPLKPIGAHWLVSRDWGMDERGRTWVPHDVGIDAGGRRGGVTNAAGGSIPNPPPAGLRGGRTVRRSLGHQHESCFAAARVLADLLSAGAGAHL